MAFPEQEIRDAVGDDALLQGGGARAYTVDGVVPPAVVFPATVEEVAAVMTIADRHALAVTPWGNGTRQRMGNPPDRLDLVLATSRLNQIVDYPHDDMTVKLQAGITLEDINRIAGDFSQMLPVDPPYPDRTTLGGLCATNVSGPLRYGFNTFRAFLIGIRVVQPDGRITKAGGMVVKNVTGFDLMKLYTGSLGTLAVIVELNLKLAPRPVDERTFIAGFRSRIEACDAAYRMMDSPLLPGFIELLNGPTGKAVEASARDDAWTLVVGFDGFSKSLDWQIDQAMTICRANGSPVFDTRDRESGTPLRQRIRNYPDLADGGLMLRSTVLASHCDAFYTGLEESPHYGDARIITHFGNGVHQVVLPRNGELTTEAAVGFCQTAAAATRRGKGRMLVEQAPLPVKQAFPVWGESTADWDLMQRLKDTMDPKHVLNPGRFVGGI